MMKRSRSKPGSPAEPVSTKITLVQDNAPKSPTTDQEMNKPITLVLSVPCDKGLSAAFPRATIETGIFPVDRDNKVHTFIVDKSPM